MSDRRHRTKSRTPSSSSYRQRSTSRGARQLPRRKTPPGIIETIFGCSPVDAYYKSTGGLTSRLSSPRTQISDGTYSRSSNSLKHDYKSSSPRRRKASLSRHPSSSYDSSVYDSHSSYSHSSSRGSSFDDSYSSDSRRHDKRTRSSSRRRRSSSPIPSSKKNSSPSRNQSRSRSRPRSHHRRSNSNSKNKRYTSNALSNSNKSKNLRRADSSDSYDDISYDDYTSTDSHTMNDSLSRDVSVSSHESTVHLRRHRKQKSKPIHSPSHRRRRRHSQSKPKKKSTPKKHAGISSTGKKNTKENPTPTKRNTSTKAKQKSSKSKSGNTAKTNSTTKTSAPSPNNKSIAESRDETSLHRMLLVDGGGAGGLGNGRDGAPPSIPSPYPDTNQLLATALLNNLQKQLSPSPQVALSADPLNSFYVNSQHPQQQLQQQTIIPASHNPYTGMPTPPPLQSLPSSQSFQLPPQTAFITPPSTPPVPVPTPVHQTPLISMMTSIEQDKALLQKDFSAPATAYTENTSHSSSNDKQQQLVPKTVIQDSPDNDDISAITMMKKLLPKSAAGSNSGKGKQGNDGGGGGGGGGGSGKKKKSRPKSTKSKKNSSSYTLDVDANSVTNGRPPMKMNMNAISSPSVHSTHSLDSPYSNHSGNRSFSEGRRGTADRSIRSTRSTSTSREVKMVQKVDGSPTTDVTLMETKVPSGNMGVKLRSKRNGLLIEEIEEGSVAADLKVGDVIVALDGVDVSSFLPNIVTKLFRAREKQPSRSIVYRPAETVDTMPGLAISSSSPNTGDVVADNGKKSKKAGNGPPRSRSVGRGRRRRSRSRSKSRMKAPSFRRTQSSTPELQSN